MVGSNIGAARDATRASMVLASPVAHFARVSRACLAKIVVDSFTQRATQVSSSRLKSRRAEVILVVFSPKSFDVLLGVTMPLANSGEESPNTMRESGFRAHLNGASLADL